jgi:hypothetical protein
LWGVPLGLAEEVGDGLPGSIVAQGPGQAGKAAAALEAGQGDDDPPEVGKAAAADQLAGAAEKPLGEEREGRANATCWASWAGWGDGLRHGCVHETLKKPSLYNVNLTLVFHPSYAVSK